MSTPYCRHIRTNGRRCCAFAVRGGSFCYFHRASNARHRSLLATPNATETVIHPLAPDRDGMQRGPLLAEYFGLARGPLRLDFPALEDRESIQLALSMLLTALGQDRIEPKRASVMLYNLQVASANAARLDREARHIVRETVTDEEGNELAPDEDPEEVIERQRFAAALEQEFADQEQDEEELEKVGA